MSRRLLFMAIIAVGVLFTSCKKDKDPVEYDFAKETVVEGKSNVENAGIEMVNQMRLLMDAEGMQAVEVFAYFVAGVETKSKALESPFFAPISAINQPRGAEVNPKVIFNAMSLSIDDFDDFDEFESIQEVFDELAGTWEWNSVWEDWDYYETPGRIEFKFPASKYGTTNNASILITYVGTRNVPSPIEEYSGDMPRELKIVCTSAGNKVIEYSLNIDYDPKGVPTDIISTFEVVPFIFQTKWEYTTSNASISYSIKNGSEVLVDMKLAAKGDLSKENMDNAQDVDAVLNSANAHFQLMNIMIAGNINIKKMMEDERSIYPSGAYNNPSFDVVEADRKMANAINKNANLVLVYADQKKKIADVEAYQYTESNPVLNWDDSVFYIEESYIGIRLKFSDGSTSDLESYFGSGFDGVNREMERFMEDMIEKYNLEELLDGWDDDDWDDDDWDDDGWDW